MFSLGVRGRLFRAPGVSLSLELIKETAIVGYVGLMDIQKAGDFIKSATFLAFMPLIGTAVIYYILIKILTVALKKVENRLRRSDIR